MSITEHLGELRTRLINVAWILVLGFLAAYFFSERIFDFIRGPIVPYLPAGTTGLYFTSPIEKFMAHVKVSFLGGCIITSPLWLYQVWAFIAPGLYRKERSFATGFMFSGVTLFVGGCAFAYYLVLPLAFKFLLGFGGTTDAPMITIGEYLDFIIKFFLAFGFSFEMPVVIVFLGLMGLVTSEQLRKGRRWAVVIIALVSAVVTPPDAVSMLALMIPLVGLYEVSIVLVRIFAGKAQTHSG
ncbi:MAG: twin-arginine translocase subunit TatC [Oligoflexia bacterium]|nr:twin-arginine translocase subunit TatC [Oligoflexia bacterium]